MKAGIIDFDKHYDTKSGNIEIWDKLIYTDNLMDLERVI